MTKFLTEKEAAKVTGLSVHWFRSARITGNSPPFVKLSGAVRYPEAELEKWMMSRVVRSTAEAAAKKEVSK